MCCASQTIQNQTQKDAKHSQMPSLHFSQQLQWTKSFEWEQTCDHSSDLAALSHSSNPSPSLSNAHLQQLGFIFWLFQVHQELKGCEEACVKKDLVWQGLRGQAVVCSVLLCCGCACQTSMPLSSEAAVVVAYSGSQEKTEKSIRKPHEIRAARAALQ